MPSPAAPRSLARRPSRTRRRILAVTSLGLAGLLAGLLSGCGTGTLPGSSSGPTPSYTQVSGNWQFSSSAAAATRLSSVGGGLTVNGKAVTGILHPVGTANQCVGASTVIAVSGSIDADSRLTLSGPVAAGSLAITGTLSADRRSLTAATYNVSGGACAFAAAQTIAPRDGSSPVTAQQYQPVSGSYVGTLTTIDGDSFQLSSTLLQTSDPDANGVYHVTGSATSDNRCVPVSLPATASTIDGGSISTSYTDAATSTSITGSGSTSPDGATITIANWSLVSVCGSASGSGVLTRQ